MPKGSKDAKRRIEKAPSPIELSNLATARDETLDKYTLSENTKRNYENQWKNINNWLSAFIAQARAEGLSDYENRPIVELECAFNNPPNRHAAYLISLYLVSQCFTENKSKSTGEQIQAACAYNFKKM